VGVFSAAPRVSILCYAEYEIDAGHSTAQPTDP